MRNGAGHLIPLACSSVPFPSAPPPLFDFSLCSVSIIERLFYAFKMEYFTERERSFKAKGRIIVRGLVMGIMSFFKRKTPYSVNDEIFDDTALSFYIDNHDFINVIEKEVVDKIILIQDAKTVDDRIAAMRVAIANFYNCRKRCEEKGASFLKEFDNMWGQIRKDGSSYISKYEDDLADLLENYDEYKRVEGIRQKHLPTLEQDILREILKKPGIMQVELYRCFPLEIKSSVSECLYFMAKNGRVKRSKHGNTYQLFIQDD